MTTKSMQHRRGALTRLRGEDGFTLTELLVVTTILGIISIPLLNVFFGYLRSSDATMALMSESHDVQIASAYWAQDVASTGTRDTADPYALMQSVEIGVPYDSGNYPCGNSTILTPTPVPTPPAIVRLAWDDYGVTTGRVR
jgi:prepilin-type N-terminal cleavage/methylation domain-containing protein